MKIRTMLLSVACICLFGAGAYCLQPAEAPGSGDASNSDLVFKTVRAVRGAGLISGFQALPFSGFPIPPKDANFVAIFQLNLAVWHHEPNVLERLAASVKDSDFPSEEVRRLLRSGGGLGVKVSGWNGSRATLYVTIPAHSEAQAQELSKGAVAFCQTWWEKQGHEYWVNGLQAMKKELVDANEALAKGQKQWEDDRALLVLGRDDSLPATALDELKTKRLLLEVDIAGATEKLGYAHQFLANNDPLRNAPDLELTDLKAREKKLNEIIHAAQRVMNQAYAHQIDDRLDLERRCKLLEADLEAGRLPAPNVVSRGDYNVTIYPIDWSASPAPGGRGAASSRGPARGPTSAPGFEAP